MYNTLYNVWKKEKENIDLQELPKEFYPKLADYLKKFRKNKDKRTTKDILIFLELKNVEKMVEELVELRRKKILKEVFAEKKVIKNLTKEEEKIYRGFLPVTDSHINFLKGLLKGNESSIEKKDLLLLRFLKGIPAIIGPNMKSYGPFKKEDMG